MSDETLSPLQAASALREAARWSDPLRQRSVGLVWLVWALATPGIFVTYAWAASSGIQAGWASLLWIPWAAMALLVSVLVARSARVERAPSPISFRELVVHVALFLAATVGVATVILVLGTPIAIPTSVVLGIGLVVAMLGARDAAGTDRAAGVWQLVGGVVLLAFALAQASAGVSDQAAALANAAASAIVLGGIGAFRYAWRG